MNIRCLIVDDEPLAVRLISSYIQQVPGLEIVGVCNNAIDAFTILREQKVDLLFLDIKMPKLSGTDFLRSISNAPKVIFITAYRDYALDGYELDIVDYLLKPVQKEELQLALDKYLQLNTSKSANAAEIPFNDLVKELHKKLQPKEYRKRFLVKQAQKLVSIPTEDIAYFYSDGRLNFFKTKDNKKFVVDYTMDELEDMLDGEKYFRISRSFYVSIHSIAQINDYFGNRLILHLKPEIDKEVLVSREKVSDFKKWMGK